MAEKYWVEKIFEEAGAILDGHFGALASGKHTGKYIDKMAVYPDGDRVSDICSVIASEMAKAFPVWMCRRIQVVVGPAEGGIILAHEVAQRLSRIYGRKVNSIFTEKDSAGRQVLKRRAFRKFVPGSAVLVVDDVVSTGGTFNAVIREIQNAGGIVSAAVVICNRGNVHSSDIFDYPLFSLWTTDTEDWEPKDCPLCKQGVPLTHLK